MCTFSDVLALRCEEVQIVRINGVTAAAAAAAQFAENSFRRRGTWQWRQFDTCVDVRHPWASACRPVRQLPPGMPEQLTDQCAIGTMLSVGWRRSSQFVPSRRTQLRRQYSAGLDTEERDGTSILIIRTALYVPVPAVS